MSWLHPNMSLYMGWLHPSMSLCKLPDYILICHFANESFSSFFAHLVFGEGKDSSVTLTLKMVFGTSWEKFLYTNLTLKLQALFKDQVILMPTQQA